MKTDFEKITEACDKLQRELLLKRILDNGKFSHQEVTDNWAKIAFDFMMEDFERIKKFAQSIIEKSNEDRVHLRAAVNEYLLSFGSKTFRAIMTTH